MAETATPRRDDFKNALIIGAVPALCSLILYGTAFSGTSLQGWVLLPGLIIGLYAGVIVSGDPHGGSLVVVTAVSAFVNYFFYVIVAFVGLRLYHRVRNRGITVPGNQRH